MFTGIIQEVGTIKNIRGLSGGKELEIEAPGLGTLEQGESISVSGVCLTVTRSGNASFSVDVSPGSMTRTTLGKIRVGEPVNLERALRLSDRLGGHLVLGHVDGVGTIRRIESEANSRRVWIGYPAEISRHLVPRGSVTVEGISLTIAEIRGGEFSVSIVPFTWDHTNLKGKGSGSPVNLEADIIGKYVETLLKGQKDPGIFSRLEKETISGA